MGESSAIRQSRTRREQNTSRKTISTCSWLTFCAKTLRRHHARIICRLAIKNDSSKPGRIAPALQMNLG